MKVRLIKNYTDEKDDDAVVMKGDFVIMDFDIIPNKGDMISFLYDDDDRDYNFAPQDNEVDDIEYVIENNKISYVNIWVIAK